MSDESLDYIDIEIQEATTPPVRIDAILAARLREFTQARFDRLAEVDSDE